MQLCRTLCERRPVQELNWSTPTCVCVCRILTAEGEDIELQGTHDAMPSLLRLVPGVAYGMSVPNTVIRPYSAGQRTS